MEPEKIIAERIKNFLQIEPELIIPHESLTKKQAEQVFRENRVVNHIELGVTILSIETVNKILRHKGFDISTIIMFIPKLYKNSMLIESQTEKEFKDRIHKKHINILFWYNTLNKFKIRNEKTKEFDKYVIRFTVEEEKVGKNRKKGTKGKQILHSSFISKVYIEKTKDGDVTSISNYLSETSPSDSILTHYLEIVKKNYKL